MRAFGLLLVAVCFACAHAYPGLSRESGESDEKKNVDTMLVLVPNSGMGGMSPLANIPDSDDLDESFEDFLSPGYFNPFRSNSFDSFFAGMQSVMNRLREQMAGILSRIPEEGVVGPWGKIPEGANTTSTTKIIDGHVVTINETTYSDVSDGTHGTVIRVRVIDVKPQNETILMTESEADSEVTTVPSLKDNETTPSRSVETVEEFDNEISKQPVETLNA